MTPLCRLFTHNELTSYNIHNGVQNTAFRALIQTASLITAFKNSVVDYIT